MVEIRVFPRQDLAVEQFRTLGQQISDWMSELDAAYGDRGRHSDGLASLLEGSPPQQYYYQRLNDAEGASLDEEERQRLFPNLKPLSLEDRHRLKNSLGLDAQLRFVPLVVLGSQSKDRNGIVAALRKFIDVNLVTEVLIEGVSWGESFDFDLRVYRKDSFCCHLIPRDDCVSADLRRLNVFCRKWWNRFIRIRGCWLLPPSLWNLERGLFPDRVEEQYLAGDGERHAESPTFTDSQRRSIMCMINRDWPPSGILQTIWSEFPQGCIAEIVIDERSYRAKPE